MKLFSHVMEMNNNICHNVLNLIIIYELVMKVQTILLEYAIIEFKKVSFWTWTTPIIESKLDYLLPLSLAIKTHHVS